MANHHKGFFASMTLDDNTEVGDNVTGADNSVQLRFTQVDAEFLLNLSNNIQPLVESQQLDFIKCQLGMSIAKLISIFSN